MTPSGPRSTAETTERDRAFAHALVESLPGVLYLYDRDGRFLKWNPHFEHASGYSADEIAGMHPLDFFDPKDHALLTARIGEVFATGASSVEAELVAKDGSRTPYFFTGQRLELDGEACLVGVGIDIGERVEAERRLGEHVKQLRILHAATDLFQDEQAPADRVLARLVDMAPRALRFPAIASARVQYGDLVKATDGFAKTAWTIGQPFATADGTEGFLEFAYRAAPPGAASDRPFGAQETHLLVSLSDMLRLYFDRRHAEQARRDKESLLKMAERVARVGAWRVDLPGFVPTWSDEVRAIHGLPPGVMLPGDYALHAYAAEDQPVLRAAMEACAGQGTPFDLELRLQTATGRRAWVRVIGEPVRDGAGAVTAIEGAIQDVTRQREAREQARVSDERFRLLARATSDAIWDWDLATGGLWWSEGIQKLFGYTADGVASTVAGWEARIHPEDAARIVAGIRAAIDDGKASWTDEYRFLRADGTVAHVVDRGHIIRDADGRPTRMIGGIADVTERKLLEAQFLRAQRLESIGTLAGGIAHDLNNVLSPLMMAVSILKMEEAPPDRASLLETIETSGRRGSDMVRQVLAFARGIEGQRLPVNVRHVFKDVEKIVRETLPKNIEQTFTAPHDLWYITADATQMHQVLMNLCVNARDAMPEGGTLRVEARNLVLDDVYSATMAALKPGPHVLVTVADTGTGMSQETQARVFEPFFTTKDAGKGTGLGLSTVLTIVKSHGGVVDLYSEPGLGTTFKVYLPADDADAAEAGPVESAALPRGRGELVLVVDDEENIRALARKTLERHGYAVMEARHGAEAVALYAQYRQIALVLTDIAMPVMDGHATIAALRALDPNVRIISSSGHAAADSLARAAVAPVEGFIAKPYTAEELLRAVDVVLHPAPHRGDGSGAPPAATRA